jgi:hypothetical protein
MSEQELAGQDHFRRGLLGYRRADVDRHLAQVNAARSALDAQVARLRAAEPLTRVGDDISALLTSFAMAVSTMRDQASADIERQRLEADQYAAQRMAEADRILEGARAEANDMATKLMWQAQQEVARLSEQQLTIAEALDRAAAGIAISQAAIANLSATGRGESPIAGAPGADRVDVRSEAERGVDQPWRATA